MNYLDIIVLAVIALSALFAFARGFVKEALSIGAWIGAGLIALYGLPHARPFAKQFIANPTLAEIAAGAALFIVSLIVLSLVTSVIARRSRTRSRTSGRTSSSTRRPTTAAWASASTSRKRSSTAT